MLTGLLDRKVLRLLLVALVFALFAGACGGGDDEEDAEAGSETSEDLSGEIAVSGSSTVEPISARVAEKFRSANPNVGVSVDGPGTGDGFALFCEGDTDISDASRPIDAEEEIPLCEKNGIEFIEIKVGIDGIAVLTSPENDAVTCLSYPDLYALLGPESEGFENWSDANALGKEVGGSGDYPDAPLTVTAPGEESGTYDSFAELVLEDIAVEERKQSEDGPFVRPDYQASPNDNVIIEGVSSSATSLGWVGYAFYVQNEGTVKALEVDGGDGCVAPTEETIKSAEYPISRFLYIYVNAANAEEKPELAAFVDYYLSSEGLASVSEVGYVDLDEADIQTSTEAWEARETGTREG